MDAATSGERRVTMPAARRGPCTTRSRTRAESGALAVTVRQRPVPAPSSIDTPNGRHGACDRCATPTHEIDWRPKLPRRYCPGLRAPTPAPAVLDKIGEQREYLYGGTADGAAGSRAARRPATAARRLQAARHPLLGAPLERRVPRVPRAADASLQAAPYLADQLRESERSATGVQLPRGP